MKDNGAGKMMVLWSLSEFCCSRISFQLDSTIRGEILQMVGLLRNKNILERVMARTSIRIDMLEFYGFVFSSRRRLCFCTAPVGAFLKLVFDPFLSLQKDSC